MDTKKRGWNRLPGILPNNCIVELKLESTVIGSSVELNKMAHVQFGGSKRDGHF